MGWVLTPQHSTLSVADGEAVGRIVQDVETQDLSKTRFYRKFGQIRYSLCHGGGVL